VSNFILADIGCVTFESNLIENVGVAFRIASLPRFVTALVLLPVYRPPVGSLQISDIGGVVTRITGISCTMRIKLLQNSELTCKNVQTAGHNKKCASLMPTKHETNPTLYATTLA